MGKGDIQVIRDTLGVDEVSHILFIFLKHCFKVFGSETFILATSLSFKRHFLSYLFNSSKQIRLTKGGGGRASEKWQKSVTYYLNGPKRHLE